MSDSKLGAKVGLRLPWKDRKHGRRWDLIRSAVAGVTSQLPVLIFSINWYFYDSLLSSEGKSQITNT